MKKFTAIGQLDALAQELWDQRSAASIEALNEFNYKFLPSGWDQATELQKDHMRKLARRLYEKGLPNKWTIVKQAPRGKRAK